MSDIKIEIDGIYINLILMSILRQRDFSKLVIEVENELKEYQAGVTSFVPNGYDGLYFVELLSRKMGSSLGEVYSLSEERKSEIIFGLIENIRKDGMECSFYDDSESTSIEFQMGIGIMDSSDETKILKYYHDFFSGNSCEDNYIYAHYLLTFQKNVFDSDVEYAVSIAGTHSFKSDYVYDNYEIWCGNSGPIADFIDEVIENHQLTTDESDEEDEIEEVVDKNTKIEVEIPVVESEPIKEGPKIIDELVKYIFDDTRTIDLLDTFEGYGQDVRYRRIVIENCKFRNYSTGHAVGFNLVIERGRGTDYVGNVTFTEFKKGETYGLAKHIEEEITEDIINKYVDTDQFYRFSKPYLLRAQNSSNRTGYGWEWDWSGGYGDYTEGTLYGETTNYFFVGAYITSDYSYDPKKRKAFIENEIEEPKVSKSELSICYYEGKLKDITDKKLCQRFLKIVTEKGEKFIPGSYDEETNIIYLPLGSSQKYKDIIDGGKYEFKRNFID